MIIDHNTLRLWKLRDWGGDMGTYGDKGHGDIWGQGTGVGTWGHMGTMDRGGSNSASLDQMKKSAQAAKHLGGTHDPNLGGTRPKTWGHTRPRAPLNV